MLLKLWDTLEKKNHTYYEQDPEKVALFLKNFNSLKHLAPVYIDETGFDTYFYREYGRSFKDQLIRGKVSGRRYQRISLVVGLTNDELIAPMTYEETMTSEFWEAWFQKFLLPTLNKPSVISMDNARFHRMGKIELLCEEFGHKLLPLPPYSPEYNPMRKHGLISKSTSKGYYQVAILFTSLCRPILVSIDYIFENRKRQTPKMTFVFVLKKAFAFFFIYQLKVSQYLAKYHKLGSLLLLPDLPGPAD